MNLELIKTADNTVLTHFLAAAFGMIVLLVPMLSFIMPAREIEAKASIQRDAAKSGAATYSVAEDGNPQFVWRTCK